MKTIVLLQRKYNWEYETATATPTDYPVVWIDSLYRSNMAYHGERLSDWLDRAIDADTLPRRFLVIFADDRNCVTMLWVDEISPDHGNGWSLRYQQRVEFYCTDLEKTCAMADKLEKVFLKAEKAQEKTEEVKEA